VGRLFYSAITSLDGFVEDGAGRFDWGRPDEEVTRFVNELERPFGTYLYGRRMYETMVFWETASFEPGDPESAHEFTRMWRAAQKVVYSRTLESTSSERTRIERDFNPQAVRHLKLTTDHDLEVAGAELAGQAIRAGLVDEIQQYVVPVIVGGGKPWLPRGLRLNLELIDSHRFASGFVYLRYRPKPLESNSPDSSSWPSTAGADRPTSWDAGETRR
jgi:dihydrofolate reductase